jgi:transferase family hexapeptide repeat protein
MLLKSGGHNPSVDPSAVIAPNAKLVGDVRIGARCVIGHGACLIAEGQPIALGEPLDFPATAYGLNRGPDGSADMQELTRRLSESARSHQPDEP